MNRRSPPKDSKRPGMASVQSLNALNSWGSLLGSWSRCAILRSWKLPMNLRRAARFWSAPPTCRGRFGAGSRGGSKAPEDWRRPKPRGPSVGSWGARTSGGRTRIGAMSPEGIPMNSKRSRIGQTPSLDVLNPWEGFSGSWVVSTILKSRLATMNRRLPIFVPGGTKIRTALENVGSWKGRAQQTAGWLPYDALLLHKSLPGT